jgi:hypothetical protein
VRSGAGPGRGRLAGDAGGLLSGAVGGAAAERAGIGKHREIIGEASGDHRGSIGKGIGRGTGKGDLAEAGSSALRGAAVGPTGGFAEALWWRTSVARKGLLPMADDHGGIDDARREELRGPLRDGRRASRGWVGSSH